MLMLSPYSKNNRAYCTRCEGNNHNNNNHNNNTSICINENNSSNVFKTF